MDRPLGPLRQTELIIAFVSPIGTPLDDVQDALHDALQKHGYGFGVNVRISKLLAESEPLDGALGPHERQERLMDRGTRARKHHGDEHLARLAVAEINAGRTRENGEPRPDDRQVHLVRSLKNPKEVEFLREIYGAGFFLIGVSAPRALRLANLLDQNFPKNEANRLLDKDAEDQDSSGQQTRATFELADAFIHIRQGDDGRRKVLRVVDLLMSCPFHSPTREEHAMYMAYSAALQSGDLSRQVGAVIATAGGDIIASGANDAPSKGGHYWPEDAEYQEDGDSNAGPDYVRGYDSNERERNKILTRVIEALVPEEHRDVERTSAERSELIRRYKPLLRETGVLDLTEFGRAVHAEMAALMSCARTGASPVNATLYCTTFPCHNCAKHIIAAGIAKVCYIEPYPKSKAKQIHDDAIVLPDDDADLIDGNRVVFQPFEGIGPRRFIDLFSLTLGNGRPVARKQRDADGARVSWRRGVDSAPRLPLDPRSYLEREDAAAAEARHRQPNHGSVEEEGAR